MDELDLLFRNNRAWSRRMREQDAGFFRRLADQQSPRYLWIGCADSRVPANEIIGLQPGEVFVHRNVANLVMHNDLNCLSVIQYAVDVLKVAHIMIVGHYGCGGIQAVLEGRMLGLVDSWLHQVEDLRYIHARRLDALPAGRQRADRLCEINVVEQVGQVARLPSVREAWRRGQRLCVHGLIYGVHDGLLRNLGATVSAPLDLTVWRKAALRALWQRPVERDSPAPLLPPEP
ncbi:carbonate dehydratase [Ramlibacter sp. 2FC]|uniref:carbonate dehydratase n=1 Tax=Ramlibacter sp. 2FC TaxID=2502188 RepID=UPI0010F4D1E8|nr:carbonate dehydratase [Ramlibacter sp. 2FC]